MSNPIYLAGLLALCAFAFSAGKTSPAYAESTGQYIADAAITAKVKKAILADAQLRIFQIQVSTNDGTVVLSGNIEGPQQEAEAVKVTGQIKGVTSVTDALNPEVASEE